MATKYFLATFALFVMLLIPTPSLAYSSNICTTTTTCTAEEVGPFMKGISAKCGNAGNCSLTDIMLVVSNVGNYVLGLIGAIVLLMYVIGGFYMLSSGGESGRVEKGKKYIQYSTVGLLIVFFAYVGLTTLVNVLKTGELTDEVDYVLDCTDPLNENELCGSNQTCSGGSCIYNCTYNNPNYSCQPADFIDVNVWQCNGEDLDMCPAENLCCSRIIPLIK